MDILVERLQIEFADRQLRNPRYSMRSFARDLEVSPTAISMILARKRKPSSGNRKKIIDRLALSPIYAEGHERLSLGTAQLEADDQFRIVAEWAHFAALNLLRPGAKLKSLPALAQYLELPKAYVQIVIDRLIRVGWVEKRGQHYVRVKRRVHTTEDIPSGAIRQHHREMLERAKAVLETIPVKQREFSTSFLMMKPADLAKAKELIREFRTELSALLDPKPDTEGATELFVFAHQLYPLKKE